MWEGTVSARQNNVFEGHPPSDFLRGTLGFMSARIVTGVRSASRILREAAGMLTK